MSKINRIVNWMIEEGTTETTTGNWHIGFSEIERIFNVSKEWCLNHHEDIKDELDSRNELISEVWEDIENDEILGFDMNFGLEYCKNWDGTEDWGI